jgi:hypothetical protein
MAIAALILEVRDHPRRQLLTVSSAVVTTTQTAHRRHPGSGATTSPARDLGHVADVSRVISLQDHRLMHSAKG